MELEASGMHDDPIGDKLVKINDEEVDGTIINFTNNEQLTENSVVLVIKCGGGNDDICKKIKDFLEKVEEEAAPPTQPEENPAVVEENPAVVEVPKNQQQIMKQQQNQQQNQQQIMKQQQNQQQIMKQQ